MITARTQYLINVYTKLNSAGRQDQFRRGRYNDPRHGCYSYPAEYNQAGPLLGQTPSEAELAELESSGYIKRNSAGSITATAKAKAAKTEGFGLIDP